jgi:Carboxypeptidase regulatory-like domain
MNSVPLPICRRLPSLALPLLLLAATRTLAAAEPPSAPQPQLAAQTIPQPTATLSGFITDSDGDSIPGARVTLTLPPAQEGRPPLETTTSTDGAFTFTNLPAGPYSLSIAAAGFAPHQTSGTLQPGESRQLPDIALTISAITDIQVIATQAEIAQAQVNQEVKQRVFGAIPNFYVVYEPKPLPLTPRQKYQLALRTVIDPANFFITGAIAGTQQATNTYAWEQGASGYAKRFAASYGTFLTSTAIGSAILPIVFKQDPRYFYKGTGSIRSRIGYAIANAVVCKGDNGRWQFDYSGILGGIAANAIANAYYPAPDRANAAPTFEGAAIDTGFSAVGNIIQEFLIRKITPHLPPTTVP